MENRTSVSLGIGASLEMNKSLQLGNVLKTLYKFECFDNKGNLKWVEDRYNLVVDEGLNDLLTQYFKGSTYTAAFYVGLIDNAGFTSIVAGDTAAQINLGNGWAELSEYDEATREVLTLGAVAAKSVDNTASKASFTMNATKSVNGAFLITDGTIDGTTGVLYGAVSFGAPRAVESSDVLNVTVTLTSASA